MNPFTQDEFLSSFRSFMRDMFIPADIGDKNFWGFKEISYLRLEKDRTLDFLHLCFPEAIFVFIIRDPFNVLASYLSRASIPKTIIRLKRICSDWRKQNSCFWEWHGSGKLRSFWIRYEDLIQGQRDPLFA